MRIVVGKGSCGFAAGAGRVYSALENLIDDKSVLSITGCIGMCFLEPIVDIYEGEKLLRRLVKVTENDAENIIIAVKNNDFSLVDNLTISEKDEELHFVIAVS